MQAKDTVKAKKPAVKTGSKKIDALAQVDKNELNEVLGPVNQDGSKDFELSDGRKVRITEAKGYHCEQAQIISGGNDQKYTTALMAQVVSIDGKPIVMEDLREMRGRDYLLIQGHFSHVNFL